MLRPFDIAWLPEAFLILLPWLPVTLGITAASVVAGSLLGLPVAAARLSPFRGLDALARGYVWVLRCTPSIVLLFLVFYGVPALLAPLGIDLHHSDRAVYVIITFTLYCSASFSEIFRSAWLSVDKGQTEAALSAGLTPWQAWRRIVVPQAALPALPNLTNSTVILLKEGALAWTIGMADLMGQGTLVIARNFGARSLETWLVMALMYWATVVCIEQLSRLAEGYLSRHRRGLDGGA